MTRGEFLTITTTMTVISTVLGWWLKARVDSSIRHQYDRLLELFRVELRRSDILHSERLAAFKVLSARLLALRRYCHARCAELGPSSEFQSRTDSLPSDENIPLLQHHDSILRSMEERELFLSPAARQSFAALFDKMRLGFNLELYLASGNDPDDMNAEEFYWQVVSHVDGVMGALCRDLGFPATLGSNDSLPEVRA
jgi:hypothetical protein